MGAGKTGARRGESKPHLRQFAFLVTLALQGLSAQAQAPYEWQLPEGIVPPPVPRDNPMSEAKVALGRVLFHDPRLSYNASTSCATCHQPELAFTDGRAVAVGADGRETGRNTPTLWNVAYNVSFTWADRGIDTLESQHLIPLTGSNPTEMGFNAQSAEQLWRDADVSRLHAAAFGDQTLSLETVVEALASYVRTLVKLSQPFDRYLFYDESDAVSPAAKRGMRLFFSESLGCSACHSGVYMSGPSHASESPPAVFHATGVSGSSEAFRAPTLKFVSQTAPYMHDGSLPDLRAVLEFYQQSGDRLALQTFKLSESQTLDLLAFLETL